MLSTICKTPTISFDERIRAKFANVERDIDALHHYQADIALPFLRDNPFSALFIDMGMGKTITSLTLIAEILNEFVYDKVLVIAPKRVACDTWPTEIGLWEHTAHLNFSLIHAFDSDPRIPLAAREARAEARRQGLSSREAGRLAQRAETQMKEKIRQQAALSRASVHIISRDWVDWLVQFHGPKWPYRMVIIDESDSFKDHRSNRFKALAKVRRTQGLIERMHLLTATPAAEGYEELFAQIYLLDLGERLGKNITAYRERYFTYNKWSMRWKLRPGCEGEILEKISDICLVMKAKDYLDIGEPLIVRRHVKLSEEQVELYRQMEDDFLVTLSDGTEIEAETAAALSSKLLQMASGVLYETVMTPDPEAGGLRKSTKVHRLHDHKIEVLKEIVEEAKGEPILVGYWFKASLDRLVEAFPQAVVMDADGKAVKAWNKRAIPILLMHPQSGGHGLNLQKGGHIIVFFDLPQPLRLFLQFIGRLARQGQENLVRVILLVAEGTRDVDVADALVNKEDAQDRLFTLLKRKIARLRKQRLEIINE